MEAAPAAAKRHILEPFTWLEDVLSRIADHPQTDFPSQDSPVSSWKDRVGDFLV